MTLLKFQFRFSFSCLNSLNGEGWVFCAQTVNQSSLIPIWSSDTELSRGWPTLLQIADASPCIHLLLCLLALSSSLCFLRLSFLSWAREDSPHYLPSPACLSFYYLDRYGQAVHWSDGCFETRSCKNGTQHFNKLTIHNYTTAREISWRQQFYGLKGRRCNKVRFPDTETRIAAEHNNCFVIYFLGEQNFFRSRNVIKETH